MSRVIFVTGGVISGIGKGVISASIGTLLKELGFSVSIVKFDPYLNIDPGVLNPYEHGEVFVTEDGLETDLDLGHYERFINQNLTQLSNITSGKLFRKIMQQERSGFYGGKTVQTIPHFSDEVKRYIDEVIETLKSDFLICEIGGTVGDIESEPYIYTIGEYILSRQKEAFLLHITYLPFLSSLREFKTKPTQFSLKTLRAKATQPNMLILRCESLPPNFIIEKVAASSGIPKNRVLALADQKQVYGIPIILESLGLGRELLKHFNLEQKEANWERLQDFLDKLQNPNNTKLTISLVAKYHGYPDAYKSIVEALTISSAYTQTQVEIQWLDARKIKNREEVIESLKEVDGVIILPGFGYFGFEGKVIVADVLQDLKIPTLGICFGFQAMVIAQARRCQISDANSYEFAEEVPQQTSILDAVEGCGSTLRGNSLRRGSETIQIKKDTQFFSIYKEEIVSERFRHRFNVVENFVPILEKNGFLFNSFDLRGKLAQSCEITTHPFYIGVQYHPEFRSKILSPHPLFVAFLEAALNYKKTNFQN